MCTALQNHAFLSSILLCWEEGMTSATLPGFLLAFAGGGRLGYSRYRFMTEATIPTRPTVRGFMGRSCSSPAASTACRPTLQHS